VLLATTLTACTARHPADDMSISTQVKIELLADPVLGGERVDVSTLNGIVTLAGTAQSQQDVDRAIAAAKRVAGVRQVKSELKIAGSSSSAPGSRLPAPGFRLPATSLR
jgi:osmotically-inducible protein OsmY